MSVVDGSEKTMKIWIVWRVKLEGGEVVQDPFVITADVERAKRLINNKSSRSGVHFEMSEHHVFDMDKATL